MSFRLIDVTKCPYHAPEPGMLFRAVRSQWSYDHMPVVRLLATFDDGAHGTQYLVEGNAGTYWLVHHKDAILDGVHFAGRAAPADLSAPLA